MIGWCSFLFCLGILAFVDSILNMGEIFRQINSVLFMLISLGLLIRTTTKMKSKKLESREKQIYNLEKELKSMKNSQEELAEF